MAGHRNDKSEDNKVAKHVRAEFTKHLIECQNAEFRVMHGVCYVNGSIGIMRGGPPDPKKACEAIAFNIIAKRTVKDVIFYNSWRTS